MTDLSKHEKLVDKYVAQARTEEAVKLLFKLIVRYAKEKNFQKAESLRDKLFEVDAMALTEIIKSAEIIEQEKSEAMDQNHMTIWSDLYETLTPDESNTLYFALKKKAYGPDEPLFSQGEKNTRLYFIEQGQLRLFYGHNSTEKLLRTLTPGTVAGEDTFFSITVCTSSLTTLSPVTLHYLDQELLHKWQVEHPGLASKLETYCSRQARAHRDLLKEKGIERRSHKRVGLKGSIKFHVLNAAGKPIGRAFKGDLSDISVGGLSFYIKTANRKNALMLLGRNLNVRFAIPMGQSGVETRQQGTIIAVINHLFSDYSIHMKI